MFIDSTGNQAAVAGAIQQAARMTGADFQYLLATAQVESNLNPNAQVSTSSAKGLFQFIEQTWLSTLKEQGPALGYGPYADAIARLPSGRYAVADPQLYDRIMNLRSDPTANAMMAGAFTRINADKLTERLGRDPTEGELYIAHFLGPLGASRLIGLAESKPFTEAASVFSSAARANPSIFYDREGRPRDAGQVYRLLVRRYDNARGAPRNGGESVVASRDTKSADSPVSDPAAITETYAAVSQGTPPSPPPSPAAESTGSVFHDLFHTGGRRGALAPVVNALWSSPGADTPASEPGATAQDNTTLDLFQDRASDVRALFRGQG